MACGRTTDNFADGQKLAKYYPVRSLPSVTARLNLPLFGGSEWSTTVSWSSLGEVTVEQARAFAAAIIEAADWCDQQGGK